MGRPTIKREWTDVENTLADRIVEAAREPSGVGTLWLIHKFRVSKATLQDVMPLAVMIAAERYPGEALLVEGQDRGYRIVKDADMSYHSMKDRLKKVDTIIRRIKAETGALADEDSRAIGYFLSMVDGMIGQLESDLFSRALQDLDEADLIPRVEEQQEA